MLDPGFLAIVSTVFACVFTTDIINEDHGYLYLKQNFVDSLLIYIEAIDAVKLLIALSASSGVILILGDIKSEARLCTHSQSVNFSNGSERFLIVT
jgi:hypothetical protein